MHVFRLLVYSVRFEHGIVSRTVAQLQLGGVGPAYGMSFWVIGDLLYIFIVTLYFFRVKLYLYWYVVFVVIWLFFWIQFS